MPPRGARARDDTEDSEGACFTHWQVARHPAEAQPFCHEPNEMTVPPRTAHAARDFVFAMCFVVKLELRNDRGARARLREYLSLT